MLPSLFIEWNAQADTKLLILPEKSETKEIPCFGDFREGLALVVLPYCVHHSGTCGAELQISKNIGL